MQQLLGISRVGPLWTAFRFIWTIRNIVSIVLLLCTVLYLLFSETLTQRQLMLAQFATAQQQLAVKEGLFFDAGIKSFAGPSQSGISITLKQIEDLKKASIELRAELVSSFAPNHEISKARKGYADALTNVLGKINLFQPGADGTISVLTALDAIERPAAGYHHAAAKYQSSVWRSFLAAF